MVRTGDEASAKAVSQESPWFLAGSFALSEVFFFYILVFLSLCFIPAFLYKLFYTRIFYVFYPFFIILLCSFSITRIHVFFTLFLVLYFVIILLFLYFISFCSFSDPIFKISRIHVFIHVFIFIFFIFVLLWCISHIAILYIRSSASFRSSSFYIYKTIHITTLVSKNLPNLSLTTKFTTRGNK